MLVRNSSIITLVLRLKIIENEYIRPILKSLMFKVMSSFIGETLKI